MNITKLHKTLDKLVALVESFHRDDDSSFNVFRAMRTADDEVRLHSRFLASLLDPNAPHGLSKTPLKLFLRQVGLPESIADETRLSVMPNYSSKRECNKIDILVTTSRQAVIIENKINALDTNYAEDIKYDDGSITYKGQLERYYTSLQTESEADYIYNSDEIEVLYLTTDGHRPSKESTGADRKKPPYPELDGKVKCISYGNHIIPWLSELITIEGINAQVKELIERYMDVLEDLTDTLKVEERKELVKTIGELSDGERLVIHELYANSKHVCWHNADDFLHEILRQAARRNMKVVGLELDGVYVDDKKRFDEIIAKGLDGIIWNGKYDFNILFQSDEGLKFYLWFSSVKYLTISIWNKFKCSVTNRERLLPQAATNYLYELEFNLENGYDGLYSKTILVDDDKEIELDDITNELTLSLTNDKIRKHIVAEVLKQVKVIMKDLDMFIAQ